LTITGPASLGIIRPASRPNAYPHVIMPRHTDLQPFECELTVCLAGLAEPAVTFGSGAVEQALIDRALLATDLRDPVTDHRMVDFAEAVQLRG
jgi:hypothetical protein